MIHGILYFLIFLALCVIARRLEEIRIAIEGGDIAPMEGTRVAVESGNAGNDDSIH